MAQGEETDGTPTTPEPEEDDDTDSDPGEDAGTAGPLTRQSGDTRTNLRSAHVNCVRGVDTRRRRMRAPVGSFDTARPTSKTPYQGPPRGPQPHAREQVQGFFGGRR